MRTRDATRSRCRISAIGVRMPTCEELATGYDTEGLTIVELAQRHEASTTRVTFDHTAPGHRRRPRLQAATDGPRPRADRSPSATANSPHWSPPATATSTSPTATTSPCGRSLVDDARARLLRPPPNKVRPPLSSAALKRQLDAGVSRADIATAHHVGLATVTRWCTHYGLNIVKPPRSTAARGVEIDPPAASPLRQRAVVGTPDRRPTRRRYRTRQLRVAHPPDPRLTRRQRTPRKTPSCSSTPCTPTARSSHSSNATTFPAPTTRRLPSRRFPRPSPLNAALADELYAKLGLSATQISLITGHSASNVLDLLRRHGTPSRTASRSPWYERTLM